MKTNRSDVCVYTRDICNGGGRGCVCQRIEV